jgi:hypothetical protein
MEQKHLEIIPGIGCGLLRFGMQMGQVKNLFGRPDHQDNFNVGLDDEICFDYTKSGLFIFFSRQSDFRFISFEANKQSGAVLWGSEIFFKKIVRIKALLAKKHFNLVPVQKLIIKMPKSIESCWEVKELSLMFFFDDANNLESVSSGLIYTNDDKPLWPNN